VCRGLEIGGDSVNMRVYVVWMAWDRCKVPCLTNDANNGVENQASKVVDQLLPSNSSWLFIKPMGIGNSIERSHRILHCY
jgi:hypothetical protein